MNTTGKIARLPRDLRIKLNRRLDNGLPSHEILEWLNRDKTVRKILAEQFDSEPISRQNLSAWRTGGYQEWTNRRDAIELMKEVSGDADDIFSEVCSENDSPCFSDKMALWYTARYLVLAKKVIAATEKQDLDRQEAAMHRIGRELAHLRRADHSAARINLQRERFEFQKTQAEEARKAKSKPAKPRGNPGLATLEKIAGVTRLLFGDDVATCLDNDEQSEDTKKEQVKKRQAAASRVKAAQSKSVHPKAKNSTPSAPNPCPTQSNPVKPSKRVFRKSRRSNKTSPSEPSLSEPRNLNPEPVSEPEPIAPPYNLNQAPPPTSGGVLADQRMDRWYAARDRDSGDFTDPNRTRRFY